MLAKRNRETLFDNERVRFFLRRLIERASTDFKKMLNMTVTTYGDNWQAMWQETLPKIQTWPAAAISGIAEEFERDVRDAALLTEFTYLRYVCLGYGKDAYGKKNRLEVDIITFAVLYRSFLNRLARTAEMIRGTWFTKPEEMDRTCANALSDALHDVSESRVRVISPLPLPAAANEPDEPDTRAKLKPKTRKGLAASKSIDAENTVSLLQERRRRRRHRKSTFSSASSSSPSPSPLPSPRSAESSGSRSMSKKMSPKIKRNLRGDATKREEHTDEGSDDNKNMFSDASDAAPHAYEEESEDTFYAVDAPLLSVTHQKTQRHDRRAQSEDSIVTANDSASQIESLGIRHQKLFSQSSRARPQSPKLSELSRSSAMPEPSVDFAEALSLPEPSPAPAPEPAPEPRIILFDAAVTTK